MISKELWEKAQYFLTESDRYLSYASKGTQSKFHLNRAEENARLSETYARDARRVEHEENTAKNTVNRKHYRIRD